MDLTYATIPTPEGTFVRLNRELEMRHHVEDPRNPSNELKYKTYDLGNYAILANSLEPIEESNEDERVNQIWHMHFDGAFQLLKEVWLD